jgi:syndecan 1
MTADGGERSLGAPRFDVVLRGYDRRQVDEHVARLQRVLARMRADLDAVRSHPFPAVGPQPGMGPGQRPIGPMPPMGPQPGPPPGPRPRPTPRPRPGGPESPDMIGSFTERMQSILQAAEEEAEEIRAAARRDAEAEAAAVRKEQESARSELAELSRQRDAVVAELTRLRGQLEGLLGAPTARFAVTPPAATTSGSSGTPAAPTGEETRSERPVRPSPRPKPAPAAPAEGPAAGAAAQPLPGAAPAQAEETTAVRRPETGAGSGAGSDSAAGDLFRPASEARGESRPESREQAEPATTMVPLASSEEDAEKPGPSARQVEPDRTVAVSAVSALSPTKRSGDTGSAENSTAAARTPRADTPGDTPAAKAEPVAAAPADEASETVKVGAVRPKPAPPEGAGSTRNARSGASEDSRNGASTGERKGAGGSSPVSGRPSASEDVTSSDRSTSGSRSG